MKKILYFGLIVVVGILVLSQGVMAGNTNANVSGTLAASISLDIGNTSMGTMTAFGNNYNDTSFFAIVNATGNSWSLSVQDNDTALAYKIANPTSIGNMTNWSAGTYVGPSLTKNINVSGTGFAGSYIGLTGTSQNIASGNPGFRVSVPVFIKQTIVGGDPQVISPYVLRLVIKFTGTAL